MEICPMEFEAPGSGMCQSQGDLTGQIAEEIRRPFVGPSAGAQSVWVEKPGPFGMQMLPCGWGHIS